MSEDDGKLEFKRMLGGHVAETDRRYYAIYSGWGFREDLGAQSFIWTLEVREKTTVLGRRTVVGQPVIHTAERRSRRELVSEAQRFEDSISGAAAGLTDATERARER